MQIINAVLALSAASVVGAAVNNRRQDLSCAETEYTLCNTQSGYTCVDISSSTSHCGACACEIPPSSATQMRFLYSYLVATLLLLVAAVQASPRPPAVPQHIHRRNAEVAKAKYLLKRSVDRSFR
ncbi:hypothetical protein BC830DRAFT_1078954 [Chytriomyces sp. MP71]|nr:hypothetical protein BC830DRAFT_1078954 [Chytriomyces sp. MP71]